MVEMREIHFHKNSQGGYTKNLGHNALNEYYDNNTKQLFVLNRDFRLRGHRIKLSKENSKTRHRQLFLVNSVFN